MKKREKFTCSIVLIVVTAVLLVQGAWASEKLLVPMGCSMGIQIQTNGVLVSELAATGNGGNESPAGQAGLLAGDLITSLNGEKISDAGDFTSAASRLTGAEVSVVYERDGQEQTALVTPDMTAGRPELGLWLRDGVTGVGTMTFLDPETKQYGGLGHSICDSASGTLIPLGSGSIFTSSVVEVVPGTQGQPGQLHGLFDVGSAGGSIERNCVVGIFGKAGDCFASERQPIPVADEDEIQTGRATILTTVSGDEVREFEIEITRLYSDEPQARCMMLEITDEELLTVTGGIVQGMSGSPIIQNGKIIGAVTHVTVNRPEKGYGVSIERMLEELKAA